MIYKLTLCIVSAVFLFLLFSRAYASNEIFTHEDMDRTLKDNRVNNFLPENIFTGDETIASKNNLKEEKIDKNTAMEEELKKGENNGQDPLKPLARFDIRFKYQKVDDGYNNWTTTLRMDKPIRLENKWMISLRFDMPLTWNNLPNQYKNYPSTEGNYNFGSGDFFTKVMFITPPKNRRMYGFGLQAVFPTASDDQFGGGKYTISPIVAGLYYPECLQKGSYAGLLLRNEFSYGGKDYRADINQLVLQPAFNANLPKKWFVTLSPEIRLDWNSGQWFVPFDITVGKLVTPKTVMSLEYKAGIIKDYHVYDYELEFRTGFFF